jgi:hypothetical protein
VTCSPTANCASPSAKTEKYRAQQHHQDNNRLLSAQIHDQRCRSTVTSPVDHAKITDSAQSVTDAG